MSFDLFASLVLTCLSSGAPDQPGTATGAVPAISQEKPAKTTTWKQRRQARKGAKPLKPEKLGKPPKDDGGGPAPVVVDVDPVVIFASKRHPRDKWFSANEMLREAREAGCVLARSVRTHNDRTVNVRWRSWSMDCPVGWDS